MEPQEQKTKKKINRRFIITIIAIIVVVLGWAGLTRAGFIPNYLEISFLCSENELIVPECPFGLKLRSWTQYGGDGKVDNIVCDKKLSCPEGQAPDVRCLTYNRGKENEKEDCTMGCYEKIMMTEKPVIYLYPTQEQTISVKLDYQGKLAVTYPEYNNGWQVTAYPDGKIINQADKREYSYLFWEGTPFKNIAWDLSTGFVVKGSETVSFLQDKLAQLGLTPKEYNEFIVYWYPKMKDNKFNLIHFSHEQYTSLAPLTITPKPDSMLRVFMVFKPLNREITVKPQEIQPFTRQGFAIVEWGGTEVR